MKRIVTILSAVFVGVAALVAKPVDADLFKPLKYELTPEASQRARLKFAQMQAEPLKDGEQYITRRYITDDGVTWDIELLLSGDKICDMVNFRDEAGQVVKYGFDRLPYYAADFRITKMYPDTDYAATDIYFTMCWPSYFIWDQVFTYEGELDNGNIPVDKRNYDPVSMSDLCNNPNHTRLFQESDAIGADPIPGEDKFEYWTMLQNAMNADGGLCTYEGDPVFQTYINATTASKLDFSAFNSEDLNTSCRVQIYLVNTETQITRTLRTTYNGPARVEGFEDVVLDLPTFGDMHIFNTGVESSETYGDANPFTAAWGPFTVFYYAIGDEHVQWIVDPSAKEFNMDVIKQGGVDIDSSEDINQYASMVVGKLFADKKYGEDTTLDPAEIEFTIVDPTIVYDEDIKDSFVEISPVLNSFVPYGYAESWSADYGTFSFCQNYQEPLAIGSRMAIGTPEGFRMEMHNHYKKTFKATSLGNVIYHYNPQNVQETRSYSMQGELVWGSGVETVAADNAKVSAAYGVITVVPAESAAVAVYSLNGACVKNVKAVAGETVKVNADKGVYIVVVNGQSQKVIL